MEDNKSVTGISELQRVYLARCVDYLKKSYGNIGYQRLGKKLGGINASTLQRWHLCHTYFRDRVKDIPQEDNLLRLMYALPDLELDKEIVSFTVKEELEKTDSEQGYGKSLDIERSVFSIVFNLDPLNSKNLAYQVQALSRRIADLETWREQAESVLSPLHAQSLNLQLPVNDAELEDFTELADLAISSPPVHMDYSEMEDLRYEDELANEGFGLYVEGERQERLTRRYERSREARNRCLEINGYRCKVCSLSLSDVYGVIAKKIIHVHHLRPISEIGKEYTVDPEIDLVPVCPNCHTIIHSKKGGMYTVEEVKKMIGKNRKA